MSAAGRPPCEKNNYVDRVPLDKNQKSSDEGDLLIAASPSQPLHAAGAQKFVGNPLGFTLGSEIRKATYTISNMCGISHLSNDRSVPLDLLHQAKGIAFLTVAKAGVIVSGRIGTGLVVGRWKGGGWSPPSAIGTIGMGWGAQIGGDITSYLIILNSEAALNSFSGQAQLSIGGEFDVAVGPVGRNFKGTNGMGGGEFLAPAYR